eukprot:GFUD01040626.1.p1 GENE.GFUD01040626.1~~GFUD01040626.1.p1  ORF type:complete len:170 (+),score=65.93 GFUD01040626.1:125-634(+)
MAEGSESGQDQEHVPSSWMECSIYQNYTASEVLVQGLAGVVNQGDVEEMVRAQKDMLQRFEKTNEMLTNVNSLSAVRLEKANNDFKKHTQNVLEMKKDLEHIFKRLRIIKQKLSKQMPEAYSAVVGEGSERRREEDDEYDVAIRQKRLREKEEATGVEAKEYSKDGSSV